MSERKVPKLRFAGFTDDWKQRQAKDIFITVSEKNHADLPVLSATQDKGMVKRDDVGIEIQYDRTALSNYKLVRRGQFVIHLRSFQGGFAYANIDGITSPAYTVMDFLVKNEHCERFWKEIFKSETFIKKLELVIYGIRDGRSINYDEFSKMLFYFPTLPEQQAIGEFFKQLDDTIAFHQREWEKYKNLKISYLEKMFPQENENKPQLRFPNFTDAWKQRKLGEVVLQIKSYSLSRNVETNKDTGFKYVHYGDIHRNIAKLLSSENNLPSIQKGNYEFLQKGDLVIADASEDYEGIGNSCLIGCFLSRNIVAGLHTIALRPTEVNPLFLYYLLHTDIFSQYGKVVATGTKVFGITAKNLLNFEFNLPSETEQQAIGEFFKQLDDTIAFHQRELEKYKNLKNGYLKQMFV